MYRNISIVVFVFFAVVLGLPESQGEGSEINFAGCFRAAYVGGNIFCRMSGYGTFNSLIFETCDLVCGGPTVKLPKKACTNGSLQKCDAKAIALLRKWSGEMMKRKNLIWMIGAMVNKGSNLCYGDCAK
uniref:Putative ixodes 10 kDa peptide protein n=1 Tax=Ixodes ricinus TaxID=34613 RepID=A0A0K8RLZ8_IXORI